MESFKDYTFKTYRCTGKNCTYKTEGMEGIEISCITPKCRGIVTPRRTFSTSKMITATMVEIYGHAPMPKPALRSGNGQFLPTQKAQKLSDASLGATMKVNASMRIEQMEINRPKDYQRIDGKIKND